jgi:hypothetical protein
MQATVIQWAWLQAPSLIAIAALFAVPNGARTSESVAVRLKKEGMRAGLPDLALPVPAAGFAGLWVEMKTTDGSVSKDQRVWHATLRALGHRVEVCRSIDAACAVLREYAVAFDREAPPAARAALVELWQQFRTTKKAKPGGNRASTVPLAGRKTKA